MIQKQSAIPTPDNLTDFFLDLQQLKEEVAEVAGVAFCMPGIVNPTTGHVMHGGALRYIQDYPLQQVLSEQLACPVSILNDAKAAALGEATYGKLKGVTNGLSVVLGTGVGLGMILDGELYHGTGSAAGEISFVNIDNRMGIEGIAVTRLSAVAIINNYLKDMGKPPQHGGKYFFQQVDRKEPKACQALVDYCETLAIQMYNLQTLFAPEKIVIGGGISQQPTLFDFLDDCLDRYGQAIYQLVQKPKILQSELGNQSNLLGALAHFQQR
ncbi:hypothetical protein IGK30_003576 [Enterococcus sp. AZ178]